MDKYYNDYDQSRVLTVKLITRTYRKIPKISPSMYKPHKPVTQKTLR